MIKKTVTYTDFEGNEKEKDLYFHFSAAEIVAMKEEGEALERRVTKMLESKDNLGILEELRAILGKAYGERNPDDPESFVKTPELSEKFMHSLAFDALVLDLMIDGDAMGDLVAGLVPKDALRKAQAQTTKRRDQDKPVGPPPSSRTNATNPQAGAMPRPPKRKG